MRILFDIVHPMQDGCMGALTRLAYNIANGLHELGCEIIFLSHNGVFTSEFGTIYHFKGLHNHERDQLLSKVDIAHFVTPKRYNLKIPSITTWANNSNAFRTLDKNTVFVSKHSANLHGSNTYIYPSLNWDKYTKFNDTIKKSGMSFLGNCGLISKNINGAVTVARKAITKLHVIGSNCNITNSNVITYGYLNDIDKVKILNSTKALVFPITEHETFGLAVIEAMYYGNYILGTTYGALPEIVTPTTGYLSNNSDHLSAVFNNKQFSPLECHNRAKEFNIINSAKQYIEHYKTILSGKDLHCNNPTLLRKMEPLEWK